MECVERKSVPDAERKEERNEDVSWGEKRAIRLGEIE
jgi:hypothetical protein